MRMSHHTSGGVYIAGRDMGGRGDIVAENDEYIVVKWAAGEHWAGIGLYEYHSPSIVVYKKVEPGSVLPCSVKRMIEWDVTRKFVPLQPKEKPDAKI